MYNLQGRRKWLLWLLGGILLCGMLSFLYKTEYSNSTGKVLNIYCWDTSFRTLLENYYPAYDKEKQCIGDVQVHWVIVPNTDNIYQTTVDKALFESEDKAPDQRIDLFLAEADYVRKYAGNGEAALSLAELGIEPEELTEQFPYTQALARDEGGVQRGITWQACPGVMIYRRDIAKKVLGTDDPAVVQQAVAGWPQFEQTAGRMQQQGFRMLAGYFDTYRVFFSGVSAPWVNEKQELVLDPAMQQWRDQTHSFSEKRENYSNNLWEKGWNEQVQGNVFCYFGPAWMIENALRALSMAVSVSDGGREETGNGTFGQWAVCQGPQPFFWGGTWLCAARGTDNAALIADIMRTVCCEEATAQQMAQHSMEFVNNRRVMRELAASSLMDMPLLGGQNAYAVMYNTAQHIEPQNITAYDQGIHEAFQAACREYFDGKISKEAAWQKFLATVWLKYPELQSASLVR